MKLFWPTMLFLGGVALGCIALGLARPETWADAENRLQFAEQIPKLNHASDDWPAPIPEPALAEPEPSAPAPLDHNVAEPPQSQTELPPENPKTPAPPLVDQAPVLQRVVVEPRPRGE